MSCFVCSDEIFKSVAKVCFHYGIRQEGRGDYPLTLSEVNDFSKKVAELNCKNFAIRYDEAEVTAEVEVLNELPLEPITVQDIKNCDCWDYQTYDYCEDEKLYGLVYDAKEWAKKFVPYTQAEYDEARWG